MLVQRIAAASSCRAGLVLSLALLVFPAQALAQEREPRRVRIAIGPELSPSFPGASGVSFGPFLEGDIARGDAPFEFEAPDESFGLPVLNLGGIEMGPAMGFQRKRKEDAAGPGLPEVDLTVELGGFVQAFITPNVRLRADIRHGVNGHEALVGEASADWVARDGDRWLISLGPRVAFGGARYHRTYFGVSPDDAEASGLPVFTVGSGVQSVGGTAGFIRQLDRRWSLHGYARYDRLLGDAAKSPIVREHGARNQFSGGLALSYTFGRGVR